VNRKSQIVRPFVIGQKLFLKNNIATEIQRNVKTFSKFEGYSDTEIKARYDEMMKKMSEEKALEFSGIIKKVVDEFKAEQGRKKTQKTNE